MFFPLVHDIENQWLQRRKPFILSFAAVMSRMLPSFEKNSFWAALIAKLPVTTSDAALESV